MTNKKDLLTLCILFSFHLNYTIVNNEKNKTKSDIAKEVNMLKTGDILPLNTFKISDSGIRFDITKKGNGEKAEAGETVTVHYTGWLLDDIDKVGKKFDSSKDRNDTFQFILGAKHVIAGWEESVANMEIGETRVVILPSELAYGSRGAGSIIPPNAKLIFEIELINSK